MAALCERVFVIGLDGLRGPAIHEADTPNLDAFRADAAWTTTAQTVMPSSSYEAWGSLFHGVSPQTHNIGGPTPITEEVAWPSFMKVARQQHPEWTMGAFSCWTPINTDIIEASTHCHFESAGDEVLTPAAAEFIRTQKPTLMFLHLDYIDGAGHGHGYTSAKYNEVIAETDARIGEVLAAIRDIGAYDSSLIIISSDHGGCEVEYEGKIYQSHGVDEPDCMNIFWACRGPGVARGVELDGDVSIMHTAPVVAHALGLDIPEGWEVRTPPAGVFTG